MKKYSGSCHCGEVQYEVELDLDLPVIECNCSYCSRKGLLLAFVPKSHFELLAGGKNQTEYRFHTHTIAHFFCRDCGVQCFAEAKGADGTETQAINVRTLEGIDLSILKRNAVDGKSY